MTPLVGGLIGIIVAGVASFIAGMFVRKRTKAEATDIITQAATRVVEDLNEALTEAKITITDLKKEIRILRMEVETLRRFIIRLGYRPPETKPNHDDDVGGGQTQFPM